MKKKLKKRRISKIWMIIIIFTFIIFLIFTSILLYDSIRNIKKLKKISSSINIPEGFYYVGGDIDTGVVISDNKNDELKGTSYKNLNKIEGNQFVWIPVGDIICNIYDMSSNTGKWTTETYSLINQPYVTRGGGFNYLDGATRNRYYNTIEYIFSFHSFRPILYL